MTEQTTVVDADSLIAHELAESRNALERQSHHYQDDNMGMTLYSGARHQSAFIAVALLAELRRLDPERADEVAVWLHSALEDGVVAGELMVEWEEQHAAGVPLGHLPAVAS